MLKITIYKEDIKLYTPNLLSLIPNIIYTYIWIGIAPSISNQARGEPTASPALSPRVGGKTTGVGGGCVGELCGAWGPLGR